MCNLELHIINNIKVMFKVTFVNYFKIIYTYVKQNFVIIPSENLAFVQVTYLSYEIYINKKRCS